TNVTISGNQGGGMSTSGTPAPIIQNSIIWGNYGDTNFLGEIDEANSGHNIIAGLEGHLPEANPLFANPISGDYRPVTGSPAIDAGSNQAYSDAGGNLDIDLDLGGTPRLMWGTIDMGAYEYPSPPAPEMKELDGKTYKLGDVITIAIDFHAPI